MNSGAEFWVSGKEDRCIFKVKLHLYLFFLKSQTNWIQCWNIETVRTASHNNIPNQDGAYCPQVWVSWHFLPVQCLVRKWNFCGRAKIFFLDNFFAEKRFLGRTFFGREKIFLAGIGATTLLGLRENLLTTKGRGEITQIFCDHFSYIWLSDC